MKHIFRIALAFIFSGLIIASQLILPSHVKAEIQMPSYFCEVQVSLTGVVVTYCYQYNAATGSLVVVSYTAPDCPATLITTDGEQPYTVYYYSYTCGSTTAAGEPEIPVVVQVWAQHAELGEKLEYDGISWEIEATTLVAYDLKPAGDSLAENIRRWLNQTGFPKIESTDIPR